MKGAIKGMEDIEILLMGLFIGFLFNFVLTVIRDYQSNRRLKVQLDHQDRKKAYLKLWDIHERYKNKHTIDEKETWASEVEKLLNSPDGVYLEDIKNELKDRVTFLEKRAGDNYIKKVKPIEEKMKEIHKKMPYPRAYHVLKGGNIARTGIKPKGLNKIEEDKQENLRFHMVSLLSKISDINYNFVAEMEKEISDIPKLIKENIRELK